MAGREASWGALLLVVVALLLVGLSFALPWWSFDSSSGRKTPVGGPQDPSDTRIERHSYDAYPLRQGGDRTPSDPQGAKSAVLEIGIAACLAAAGLLVAFVGEVTRLRRAFPRWLSLSSLLVCAVALLVGLVVTWLLIPPTLSGSGVQGAFTDRLLDTDYIRSAIGPGWVAAAVGILAALGAFAFRFQAGTQEASAVEAYA